MQVHGSPHANRHERGGPEGSQQYQGQRETGKNVNTSLPGNRPPEERVQRIFEAGLRATEVMIFQVDPVRPDVGNGNVNSRA